MVVTEGATAVLQCRASGSPAPHITWVHNGRIPVPTGGRYEVLDNGALRIRDIQVGISATLYTRLYDLDLGRHVFYFAH